MSESQKRRRDLYRRNRKRLIWALSVILCILVLLMIISTVAYAYISRTYFVDYTEQSDVSVTVGLKDNEFFDDPYIDKDHTYVAALIDRVYANFIYDLYTDAENVNYEYSYGVEAQLLIMSEKSDEPIFDPTYVIQPEQRLSHNANSPLRISHSVVLDYDEYNDIANQFFDAYGLPDTISTLVVRLTVKVHSTAAAYDSETTNLHVIELNIPLTQKAVDIEMTSSVPVAETKQIACNGSAGQAVVLMATMVLGVLTLFMTLFLVAFILLTRNSDTTYEGKIKKILSSYKSHVQKINNPFDKEGYQVLLVDTFAELLEIRETIQAPILMHENSDQTRTEFLIPTNTKLLYLFSLQVEGYEELYAEPQPAPEPEPVVAPAPMVVKSRNLSILILANPAGIDIN